MNFSEFIEKAKMVLKEDAGSEGSAYLLKYEGELKENGFKAEKVGEGEAKILFEYPHDFGLALQVLKDLDIKVISLELLF